MTVSPLEVVPLPVDVYVDPVVHGSCGAGGPQGTALSYMMVPRVAKKGSGEACFCSRREKGSGSTRDSQWEHDDEGQAAPDSPRWSPSRPRSALGWRLRLRRRCLVVDETGILLTLSLNR